MRMFGRPRGILGRLGGIIMARTNAGCGAWVTDLLDVGPNDNVLEVGFGPGVVIQRLSKRASAGHVAGIDPSREMVEQARARNTTAIQNGRVDLRRGSVRACHLMTIALIRRWRLTPCKSGRTDRWVARNATGHEVRCPSRGWLYALFGAAEARG